MFNYEDEPYVILRVHSRKALYSVESGIEIATYPNEPKAIEAAARLKALYPAFDFFVAHIIYKAV